MKPEALARQLSAALFKARKVELLKTLVLLGEGSVKRRTPVRKGTLRRSITGRVITAGERGAVGTNLTYGRLVHEGTRPHVIRPSRARALFWSGAAHPVRSVQHPGTKGQPFLLDGLADARPEMERAAAAMGETFFAGVK